MSKYAIRHNDDLPLVLDLRGADKRRPRKRRGRKPLRFEDAVDLQGPGGCWIWLAGKNSKGYGSFGDPDSGRKLGVHRLFYEAFVGPIPDALGLDHLCRTPACVNPLHLEPVTQAVNSQRGLNAKLTPELVAAIRRRSGEKAWDLAEEFGVSLGRISAIRRNETWRVEEAAEPTPIERGRHRRAGEDLDSAEQKVA